MVKSQSWNEMMDEHASIRRRITSQPHNAFGSLETPMDDDYCSAPLSRLRLTAIDDLDVGEVHYGEWILCKSASPPLVMVGMMAVSKCQSGGSVRVAIYNFANSQADADKRFPTGTIFAIKEPYFKMALDGELCVRVDDPGNVQILKPSDPLVQQHAPQWFVTGKENLPKPTSEPRVSAPSVNVSQSSASKVEKVPVVVMTKAKAPAATPAPQLARSPKPTISAQAIRRVPKAAPVPTKSTAPKVTEQKATQPNGSAQKATAAKPTASPKVTGPKGNATPAPQVPVATPPGKSGRPAVSKKEPQVPPVEGNQCRLEGNAKLAAGEFDEALRLYREAALLNPADVAAVSNQAEVWLRLGAWNSAVRLANQAIAKDPNHVKSLFRRARGLIGRHSYKAALDQLRAPILETCEEAIELELKCEDWQRQADYGHYLWEEMGDELIDKAETRFPSVAEFRGPIKVLPVKGKGEGVKALANMKRGQLVCVAKPAALVFTKDVEDEFINFENIHDVDSPVVTALAKQLLDKFPNERSLAAEVKMLHRGKWVSENAKDFTEEQLVRQIVAANSFGFIPALDGGFNDEADLGLSFDGAGLWLLPAKFNHSCTPNCSVRVWGDLMVLVANQSVAKGEELTVSYVSQMATSEDKNFQKNRFENRGFTCDCDRCIYLNSAGPTWRDSDPVVRPTKLKSIKKWISQIEEDLKKLGQVAEVDAVELLQEFGHELMQTGNRAIGLKCFQKVFDIADTNPYLRDVAPEICAVMASNCAAASDTFDQQNEWLDRFGRDEDMMMGPVIARAVTELVRDADITYIQPVRH